jgi:hypothetical protein
MRVEIIDDFLPDPEAYRQEALKREFRSFVFPEATFYGIAPVLLDNPVPVKLAERMSSRPTLSFFRRSPEGQIEPHFIHTDVDMGEWSAILYLNPDPPTGDGTMFWTHRETGLEECDAPHKYSEAGQFVAGWHVNKFVKAKFNRMLIFKSNLFHSRSLFLNWTQGEESRLTQVTFGGKAA